MLACVFATQNIGGQVLYFVINHLLHREAAEGNDDTDLCILRDLGIRRH